MESRFRCGDALLLPPAVLFKHPGIFGRKITQRGPRQQTGSRFSCYRLSPPRGIWACFLSSREHAVWRHGRVAVVTSSPRPPLHTQDVLCVEFLPGGLVVTGMQSGDMYVWQSFGAEEPGASNDGKGKGTDARKVGVLPLPPAPPTSA
jgi:hypothetical protein